MIQNELLIPAHLILFKQYVLHSCTLGHNRLNSHYYMLPVNKTFSTSLCKSFIIVLNLIYTAFKSIIGCYAYVILLVHHINIYIFTASGRV